MTKVNKMTLEIVQDHKTHVLKSVVCNLVQNPKIIRLGPNFLLNYSFITLIVITVCVYFVHRYDSASASATECMGKSGQLWSCFSPFTFKGVLGIKLMSPGLCSKHFPIEPSCQTNLSFLNGGKMIL